MRRFLIIITMLVLGAYGAEAQRYYRGYDAVPSSAFIEKGAWSVGGSARYSQHVNSDHSLLVISNIDSEGYSVSARPRVMYSFKDNLALGLKLSYDRSMLDLTSADLAMAQIEMNAADCYQTQHKFAAYGVFRTYIPLGNSKRVAMFADIQFGGSYKQGKAFNAGGDEVYGFYNQSYAIEVGVDPGIIAFLTDRLAVEMNVGILGVNYTWTDQIRNQVYYGKTSSASAGFMVNLLSLGVGISYYIL